MPGWSDPMTMKDGRGRVFRINRGSREILYSQNRVQRSARYGSERSGMIIHQGSKSKGSLSGNTHAGWDAWDRSDFNTIRRSKCARIHGVFDSHRKASEGPWIPHGHAITDGGDASSAGMVQLGSYHRNDNGLRGNATDKGFKMHNSAGKRIFPLYVGSWKPTGKHGLYLCDTECGAYEYQSASSPRLRTVKKGLTVSISAVTAVVNSDGKHFWGITDTKGDTAGGEVVFLENFHLTEEKSPWLV